MEPMKPGSQLPSRTDELPVGEPVVLEETADTVTSLEQVQGGACAMVVTARHSGDCLLSIRIDPVTHLNQPVFIDPYFWTFELDGRAATRQDLEDANLSSYSSFRINASQRRLNLER